MSSEDNIRYRFSGYQLPMLELDETGHAYYYIKGIHPYYTSQPLYWSPGVFPAAGMAMIGGNAGTSGTGNDIVFSGTSAKGKGKLYKL